MDNHNPTDREKERAKILIEELKILQSVINRMVQNSLECKKWTLALAVGVLSLKIEAISHLYGLCLWVMRFSGVVSMFLSFRRLLSHARKVV
ncbi:hypothetical protein [Helicobacter pylori]|uniref:hypothetical protein n=1 Tax=Helicobacter pylori TaxID=210 RepID=UPI0029280D75|nr:hypothetical protein [Helicobacter pylori]MDU9702058.1 hypothetical protein [Helicobacter pylori]